MVIHLYIYNYMNRARSIFLVNIIFMMLLPWQLMCMAHPMGHAHHHVPGELSQCEQRKLCKETSIWPPMDCHNISITADDYQLPQNDKLTSSVQALAIVLLLTRLVQTDLTEDILFPLPDPRCHSGPLLLSNSLRAPPLT